MEALRSVARRDARPQRGVGIHTFAGGRASQHLQHHFEILETRQNLLNAGQRNEGARQREAHAAVAFGLSTTATAPVSAMRKFAPLIAVGTERNFCRR